jgi:hypothetical protein
VSGKDAAEQRATTIADAKGGLKFTAGHQVVVIIGDGQGTPRRTSADGPADDAATRAAQGAPGGKKNIGGTFRVGDHVVKAATFRLHKDSGDGPLLTPENLGGETDLQWAGDHWATGADGKYKFTGLAEGKYFVELFGKPEADA